MKFTIETEPFQRMLDMLAQASSEPRHRFVPLRLDATGSRLRVQQGGLAAEIEAVVWQDGRCAISANRLKHVVAAEIDQSALTIELTENRLRVGDSLLPCVADCPPVRWQASSRIFFSSDLGVVASNALDVRAVA